MPFPRELLLAGEETFVDEKPHWWTMVAPSEFLGVMFIAMIFLLAYGVNKYIIYIALAVFLIALSNFIVCYLRWTHTIFVVTNERLVFRSGIIGKQGMEIPLDRITNISFHQGVFERLIGAGDLTVESAGEDGKEVFHDVRKPARVQHEIYGQMEGLQMRDARRNASYMQEAAIGSHQELSIPEQISKLDELRSRGLLSDAEFEEKKHELLGRM